MDMTKYVNNDDDDDGVDNLATDSIIRLHQECQPQKRGSFTPISPEQDP